MLLSALENVFPPVPADVAAALGAFWAVRAGVSPVLVGVLCFLGNQASAMGVYFWVRGRGEAVRQSREFHLLLPPGDSAGGATLLRPLRRPRDLPEPVPARPARGRAALRGPQRRVAPASARSRRPRLPALVRHASPPRAPRSASPTTTSRARWRA